jgi:hypothetical protein
MTKREISRQLRRFRRVVGRLTGGFLPEPLSVRSTLATAIISAVVLAGFGDSVAGFTAGLVLAGAVWYMDMIEALTSKASALAMHSRLSISYISWLCVGLGGLYANLASQFVWLEWICVGVLAISGWLTSAQPGFLDVKPLGGAANLKHFYEQRIQPRLQVKQLLCIIWASVGITGIFAALAIPATPWVTLALATVTTAVVTWSVGQALLYADHARWRPIRELHTIKPRAVIPYDGTATYQAEMWYPYLNQLGAPYYIIALTETTMWRLAQNTDVPIVVPADETESELKAVIPNTVRVAYYPHNSRNNLLFMSDDHMSHVFIHHGDGDKAPSFNKRSAQYDYLFVAGQGAIDRYADHGIKIPQSKFKIIGRPQTEFVAVDRTPIKQKDDITVLYAPTWRGKTPRQSYSSLPMGPDIIDKLLARGTNVIFRPHPLSHHTRDHQLLIDTIHAQLQEDCDISGRHHLWGDQVEKAWSVADAANTADAMIADVSGIVTDFMQSGKPYAMVSPHWTAEAFRSKFPTSQSAYVIDQSPASIDAALDAMIGDDPLAGYRWQRRSYYLGGFEGHESVDRFIEESRKLMHPATPQGEAA